MATDTPTHIGEQQATTAGNQERPIESPSLASPLHSSFFTALKKSFSFPVLMATALLGANYEMVKSLRLDPDTWWHMKYGETILRTGHWPTVDTWSFTVHGMPRVAYEWGGEVVMDLAYRLGGLRGMDVLLIVLTSTIVLLLYGYAWLRCQNPKAAFVGTALLLPVAAVTFTLRPQLLGYIFLLIALVLLEGFRQERWKSLWVLPPLFLVWVNTHGSFTLGFMVLGLYWLCGLTDFSRGGLHATRWRPAQRLHMELVCLFSLLALFFTPYGTRLAAIPLNVATSLPLNFADIIEWRPLPLGIWEAKLLVILLFAFIVAQVAFRRRYRLEELALFVIAGYLVFEHYRFAILYAILFAPLVASVLAPWIPAYNHKIDKYAINAALILAALFAAVWYFPSHADLEKNVGKEYPVQAVRYLQTHPVPGRMFNDYGFGGYLVWTMAPTHKVFIDGRGDIYELAGVFSAYMDAATAKPDALAVLQSYRIKSCLIERQSTLATLLAESPDWKRTYSDKLSALFIRTRLASFHSNATGKEVVTDGR